MTTKTKTSNSREVRFNTSAIELREGSDGGPSKLVGYAAVFNRFSENLGGFVEKIAPGAFRTSLEGGDDILAYMNHEGGLSQLGRRSNGTLTLVEDDIGLRVEITPPDTTAGRDALTLVSRGDVQNMSFGFSVREDGDEWIERDDGMYERTLNSVRLFEVSPVSTPAYPDTTIAARSLDAFKAEQTPADESAEGEEEEREETPADEQREEEAQSDESVDHELEIRKRKLRDLERR